MSSAHAFLNNNAQNVNRIVDIPTFAKVFWCKLVQINVNLIKHLTDLKHRHLAGAFFLALIPDNNFVWFEYCCDLIVLIFNYYYCLEQIINTYAYFLINKMF